MSALFPRWSNSFVRVAAFLLLASPLGLVALLMVYVRTGFTTGQHEPVDQPLQFDHRHHVADDGIDCRYCHSTVESSAYAGVPGAGVCMSCHNQIWNQSPMLGVVRQAYFTDRPIQWARVHQLAQFVYFNHSIHVSKGIGCETCHGRVDRMATLEQDAPLTMGWCLGCHRNPGPNLRPASAITQMDWSPQDPEQLQRTLLDQNHIHTRTSCSTCHR